MTTTSTCRGCGAGLSDVMVDLGASPLANSYVPLDRAHTGERTVPLTVYVCSRCFLAQVHHEVDRSEIFSTYAYQSSWSAQWVERARWYVEDTADRLDLGADSNVVEVASNDGYLLQWFARRGVPVLGIDPASNVAPLAEARGVPTRVAFFGVDVALQVLDERGPADLIVANNVLAHVDDLHDLVAGLAVLLGSDGRASLEFPHLLRLIDELQFDTIYHEHFSYLSLLAIEPVLAVHGLQVVDVEELPTHGGSLRLWVALLGATTETEAVEALRLRERSAGLEKVDTYCRFGSQVATAKRRILRHLIDLRDRDQRIAAYGAAAKGNTLLNYCGIGPDMIEFVVDANPDKQGTLLPGSRIPVRSPEVLVDERPDVVVLLPWNLTGELIGVVDAGRWGGEIHVLRPDPAVVLS
jgi:SAM-dependent methyltransferase